MLFHHLNTGHYGLSCEAAEDVELVLFLLASADKVVHQQFYRVNNLLSMCYQQQLPFCQVTQFTGIQAILDSVASTRRVNVIDLGTRSGLHRIILMQTLAVQQECLLELLKITAVITSSKERIEETGKRLSSFAESVNLPYQTWNISRKKSLA